MRWHGQMSIPWPAPEWKQLPIPWPARSQRTHTKSVPVCGHPEKEYHSLGMCVNCYDRDYRRRRAEYNDMRRRSRFLEEN
jgi:hypothetical protein